MMREVLWASFWSFSRERGQRIWKWQSSKTEKEAYLTEILFILCQIHRYIHVPLRYDQTVPIFFTWSIFSGSFEYPVKDSCQFHRRHLFLHDVKDVPEPYYHPRKPKGVQCEDDRRSAVQRKRLIFALLRNSKGSFASFASFLVKLNVTKMFFVLMSPHTVDQNVHHIYRYLKWWVSFWEISALHVPVWALSYIEDYDCFSMIILEEKALLLS